MGATKPASSVPHLLVALHVGFEVSICHVREDDTRHILVLCDPHQTQHVRVAERSHRHSFPQKILHSLRV